MNTQALNDLDTFRKTKQDFYQGKVSEEVIRAAATRVLENTIAAEIKIHGKAKTKINSISLARMIR
jgi:hypothetical protein